MKTAEYWIENLCLETHPEGGYFKEIYRSSETIKQTALPERFTGSRCFSTSIYYLLKVDDFSMFHRIKQDEIWHFYDGDCLYIHVIDSDGNYSLKKLGLNIEKGELPQITINTGDYFAAEPAENTLFCLAGCTVAPGFDFADFYMPEKQELLEMFPEHDKIISQLGKE